MRAKNCRITVSLLLCLASIVVCRSPVYAAQWYDYYLKAQQAIKKKDRTSAIEFFKKAIEADPEPAKNKKYGMQSMSYYPYFELGMAYLATGDIESAYQYCEQAQKKGVAPERAVNNCLATAATFLQRIQKAPSPTPVPQQNIPPRLRFFSTIPSETTADTITLQGTARDTDGIKEISLSVENLGITGIMTLPYPLQREEETFNIQLPLDFGQSTITLEAIDMRGNRTKQKFITVRRPPSAPVALPTPLPTPVPTQTPSPTPVSIPTPLYTRESHPRPSIELISEIPAETSAETLKIQGTAMSDHGIKDVNAHVQLSGRKGLTIAAPTKRTFETFDVSVNLHIGQNTITIEAIDNLGQTVQKTVSVTRKPGPAGDTASSETLAELPIESLQRRENVYAVIIGIGEYQDQRIPPLRFTVNDAQGLYDILTDPEYGGVPEDHIALLLNEEATDRNIKRTVGQWLRRQARKEDTVIIYYAGHGAPEMQDTYWVTYNANIDDLYTTALNNNDIFTMLGRVESERVITFLDSCYSAATVNRQVKTRSLQTEIPLEKFSGKGRVTISASNGKQLSLELQEYQHGVFTYYLLEGLKGKADNKENPDGVVDVDEIWNYVKDEVTETARKAGNPQTPEFQGSVTAGIPLTINVAFFREQQRQESLSQKQEQLKELFTRGLISAELFNCAYTILKSGESNILLDGFLSGEIDPDVFSASFQCN